MRSLPQCWNKLNCLGSHPDQQQRMLQEEASSTGTTSPRGSSPEHTSPRSVSSSSPSSWIPSPRVVPNATRPRTTRNTIKALMDSMGSTRPLEQKLAKWIEDCPPLETRARTEAVKAISKAVRKKAKTLDLNRLNLTSLPDCLKDLHHLEKISLTENHLKELPALPPALKILAAESNQLSTLPALPPTLTELKLTANLLESLPDLPDTLTTLSLGQNLLKSLPALPRSLAALKLNHNRFVELPTGLEAVLGNNRGVLNASNNPWDDRSMARLSNMSRSIDIFDMAFAAPDSNVHFPLPEGTQCRSISTAVDAVLKMMTESTVTESPRERAPEGQSTSWDEIAIEEHAAAFALFLKALSRTKANEENNSRYTQRIDRLLEALEKSAILRGICFPIALEACGDCHDRVALTLNDMEMAILTHRIETGSMNTDTLFDHLRGMFRLEAIDAIATAHVVRRRDGLNASDLEMEDEAQLRFGYHTLLADRLDLPVVARSMHYPACSNVSVDDLHIAEQKIRKAENSDRFVQFLARWEPWQKAMERLHPRVFETMRADREIDRMHRLSFPNAMTETEYLNDLKNLAAYEKLTLSIKMAPLTRDFILQRENSVAR